MTTETSTPTATAEPVASSPPGASRRYVFPRTGETLAEVAQRTLPGTENAEQVLLSWNLHLAVRMAAPLGAPGTGTGGLLGTDIVYVEPPVA